MKIGKKTLRYRDTNNGSRIRKENKKFVFERKRRFLSRTFKRRYIYRLFHKAFFCAINFFGYGKRYLVLKQ